MWMRHLVSKESFVSVLAQTLEIIDGILSNLLLHNDKELYLQLKLIWEFSLPKLHSRFFLEAALHDLILVK